MLALLARPASRSAAYEGEAHARDRRPRSRAGPGTVDRRAGQVWRNAGVSHWLGEKATSPPGAVDFSARHRPANSKHGLGAVGVGVSRLSPCGLAYIDGRRLGRGVGGSPAGAMAEDVADAGAAGGYAALHERGRLAQSRAWLVRRRAIRPGVGGRVGRADGDGSTSRRGTPGRAPSPERLQRAWDDARSRRARPPPPRAESGLGPARSPARRASG